MYNAIAAACSGSPPQYSTFSSYVYNVDPLQLGGPITTLWTYYDYYDVVWSISIFSLPQLRVYTVLRASCNFRQSLTTLSVQSYQIWVASMPKGGWKLVISGGTSSSNYSCMNDVIIQAAHSERWNRFTQTAFICLGRNSLSRYCQVSSRSTAIALPYTQSIWVFLWESL